MFSNSMLLPLHHTASTQGQEFEMLTKNDILSFDDILLLPTAK
jgi:hypothetical protein